MAKAFGKDKLDYDATGKLMKKYSAIEQVVEPVKDMFNNYMTLREINKDQNLIGSSDYYHAKASCESAQKGKMSSAVSESIGVMREFTDFFKDTIIKGKSVDEALKNNEHDLKTNSFGRNVGKFSPNDNCSNLVKVKRPKQMKEKYW